MNVFSDSNRIRLHQLTIPDMIQCTSDKLGHLGSREDEESTSKAIVDNANGIFLWVVLVTKRIREKFEDSCSVADLYREIDALPNELDELFAHLLDSLPQSDEKMAYQVFLMLLYRKEKHPQAWAALRLLSISFLEDYNRDPQFALSCQVSGSVQGPVRKLGSNRRADREEFEAVRGTRDRRRRGWSEASAWQRKGVRRWGGGGARCRHDWRDEIPRNAETHQLAEQQGAHCCGGHLR
jgi:hypothetical protein